MGEWTALDANQLLPTNIVQAVHGIADLTNAALSVVKAGLDSIPSVSFSPDIPSPAAIAAGVLLDALESLLTGSKVHILPVPIAKIPPTPDPPKLPASVPDLETWLNVTLPKTTNTSDSYQRLVAGAGGNAGFYRAFAESFFDPADQNRPQYTNQSDAVVMAVVMAGASSYASIAHAASLFDQLLKPKGSIGSLNGRITPTPQNVVVKPVPSATGSQIAVKIEWDAPKPVFSFPSFPGLSITVSKYAVIRLVGADATSVRSVLDVFPTQDLTEGMTNKKATVVAMGSGKNSSYLDKTPPTTDGSPVYYCVAWETEVIEPSGNAVSKFDRVSSVIKVFQKAPTPSQTGTSPDWVSCGAAADAFPSLANAAQLVLERAKLLVNGKPSPKSRLETTLKAATKLAGRLEDRATDLMADVDRLAASLSRPLPGLYVTQVVSGTGGNAFLISELANRLGDLTDETRPPFDNGEYVCGVVFVAGAPRLADLASTIAFFEALFGPAQPSNPLLGILTAIDTVVTAEEATVFDPSMNPTTETGLDPLTGLPPKAVTPVISLGGTPVSTDSPENPNQGDTNVTPLSELC